VVLAFEIAMPIHMDYLAARRSGSEAHTQHRSDLGWRTSFPTDSRLLLFVWNLPQVASVDLRKEPSCHC
jgi:hypothetical protein